MDMERIMPLQQYVRQIKLRDESYVNHVDRIQDLLSEANRGFQYELDIYEILKGQNLTPPNFKPAGGGHGPDGMFMYHGTPYNFEIKLDQAADYGQVELRYKNGSWDFGGKNEEAKALYNSVGVLDFVRKNWDKSGAPRRETISTKDFTEDDMRYDYANFKDAFMFIPSNALSDHYAKKGTYYIQVGKAGFYHLKKDVAKLGTPKFDATLKLRIRIKRRTSRKLNGYGFLTALKIDKKASKSKFDLDTDLEFLRK
jgi:hypothetical protein